MNNINLELFWEKNSISSVGAVSVSSIEVSIKNSAFVEEFFIEKSFGFILASKFLQFDCLEVFHFGWFISTIELMFSLKAVLISSAKTPNENFWPVEVELKERLFPFDTCNIFPVNQKIQKDLLMWFYPRVLHHISPYPLLWYHPRRSPTQVQQFSRRFALKSFLFWSLHPNFVVPIFQTKLHLILVQLHLQSPFPP